MKRSLPAALKAAAEIHNLHYADASVVLLAGSIVRGEATKYSDLDLIVIYERVKQAKRQSFRHNNWPVETFVHDPQTLEYFFREVDLPTGVPSLLNMVSESLMVTGESGFGHEIKELAEQILSDGPTAWSDEDRDNSRYAITNMIDDIRAPNSRAELIAVLTDLYSTIANHACRSRGHWAAKGKAIPRCLSSLDPEFGHRFEQAFLNAFERGDTALLVRVATDVLKPDGGFLFEGYERSAPKTWRAAT